MAVSKFTSSSNVNDFNINVQSTYSAVTLTQEYPIGAYSFTSSLNDTSMDLYFYNGIGALVGYTNTKGIIVSGGFNKVVIIGGTVGDVLGFTYKTTYNSTAETAEPTAGPVILSITPTTLPNINSSTTVTGLNFATDIAATFTGSDNQVRNAKSVVRGSVNSLVVTRPDTFPTAYSPYTLTVTNPSVAYQPTGSNSNTIAVTAGVNPVWVTTAIIKPSIYNVAYTTTLSATDADSGSSITSYAITAGSLPTGLTFNTSTGVISGTPTGTGAASFSITIVATDSGGNTASQAFTIQHLGNTATADATYYYQSFTANTTYTPPVALTADILLVAGGGGGGGSFSNQGLAGGGGAGGYIALTNQSLTVTPYTLVVGAGGTGVVGVEAITQSAGVWNGVNTTGFGQTSIGGGVGSNWIYGSNNATSTRPPTGGSGGGGGNYNTGQPGGLGTSGQGSTGGSGAQYSGNPGATSGGGGGGAGAAGGNGSGGTGGNGGAGLQWLNGTYYAGGGGGTGTATIGTGGNGGGGNAGIGNNSPGVAGTPATGGGGGAAGDAGGGSAKGGNGGSGVIVLRYTRTQVGG